jgi:hypothetical protein
MLAEGRSMPIEGSSEKNLRRLRIAGLWIVALLMLPASGRAQSEPAPVVTPDDQPKPTAPAVAPIRDQKALDLLKRMSETLAATKAFTYRSRGAIELRAKTAQFVTLFGDSEVTLERPNKLHVKVTGEVPNFELYYDGKSVTAYAAKDNVYSTPSAPSTIDETIELLQKKAGIHFPSSDLMVANPYAVLAQDLTSGFVVGPAMVDGSACEHLAFRTPDSNWEIWIEDHSALPRRLLVTYTTVPNFPRLGMEFSCWNLTPTLAASRFEFTKSAGAKQIDFRAATEEAPRIP